MTGTFIARHPLTTYCALTFAISWGGFVLVVGPGGFPGEGSQFDSLMPLVAAAILAGPSVTGILLTALLSGRAGLRELLSRLLRWRVAARWYAAALVMIGIVVGLTTVFVGVAWGAWHLLQMLWISGTYAGTVPLILYVPLNVLGSVMQLTAYRVLMVRVHDRTESLFVATLMHASLTTSTIFIFTPAATGAAFLSYVWTLAAVLWAVVAAVVWTNAGRFSQQPRERLAA